MTSRGIHRPHRRFHVNQKTRIFADYAFDIINIQKINRTEKLYERFPLEWQSVHFQVNDILTIKTSLTCLTHAQALTHLIIIVDYASFVLAFAVPIFDFFLSPQLVPVVPKQKHIRTLSRLILLLLLLFFFIVFCYLSTCKFNLLFILCLMRFR